MKYLFYLAFASLLISSSCADNPVIIKDPCEGAKPFKADFTIYEQLWYDSLFVADTIAGANNVHVIANEVYDTYKWNVGEDTTTFYTKKFTLKFKEPYNSIPIRLIATKTPSQCFPNDKKIDTIIKYITIVTDDKAAIIGNYRGVSTFNLKDTFTISIYYKTSLENKYADCYYLINLNNGCEGFYILDVGREIPIVEIIAGYRSLKLDGRQRNPYKGCEGPYGYATLNKECNEITVNYTLGMTSKQSYTYIGKRVK